MQENTKVELVTETIEALVLASLRLNEYAGMSIPTAVGLDIARANVVDARANLAYALRELLKPTLRVVSNEPTASKEVIPYDGKGIEGMNLA